MILRETFEVKEITEGDLDLHFTKAQYLPYSLRFSFSQKLWFEDHTFLFLNSIAGEGSGKLYVTNSGFSNGIRRLYVIILHPFFPSVKLLLLSVNPSQNILFLPK
jgi:hypothetical protein